MNSYKALHRQIFSQGAYSIVPIRFEDRFDIMKWRNEQIYHLRQNKPLTEKDQEYYFDQVVSKLFEQEQPNQILFSYLENNICIGYGGLVHVNWVDKNAEISFIMNTALETEFFELHWKNYLSLLEKVAFNEMGLHKIYTYAFDLRPRLYAALDQSGFKQEARLNEHCRFQGNYIDVVIHSKVNALRLRKALDSDLEKTFQWAKNPILRKYSFNQNEISETEHRTWFGNKIRNENSIYLIMEDSLQNELGSIRIDLAENREGIISYLIDPYYHGRGYGKEILRLLENYILENELNVQRLTGYVVPENIASMKIFENLGFHKIQSEDNLKYTKELK